MSTFEGWAEPTSFTDEADHTFVICRDNGEKFGCWNGGNPKGPSSVHISTGSHPNAYEIANRYRVPDGDCPDTAGIGWYLWNGVCHQSANCFLLAANTVLHQDQNDRPKGYFESTFTYGKYGTDYDNWFENYYRKSGGDLPKPSNDPDQEYHIDPIFNEVHQAYARLRSQRHALQGIDLKNAMKISDTAILIKHAAPEVDLEPVADLQKRYLQEHDEFVSKHKGKVADMEAAKRINELSKQYQKFFSQLVGPENYRKITGHGPNETVNVANMKIIEKLQKQANQR